MAETNLDDLPKTRKEAMALGVKRYFTGKLCPRGHISIRLVKGACVECERKYNKTWEEANRERHLAASRAWKRANPEKNAEIHQAWCKDNPGYFRQYQRDWREKNPELKKEIQRAWCEANPDKVITYNRNRRARKRAAEGYHSADDITSIREAQRDKCAYCRKNLKGKGHLDHIRALSKGGTNWPSNLQLVCQRCNQMKHARDPIEFAQSLGKLI